VHTEIPTIVGYRPMVLCCHPLFLTTSNSNCNTHTHTHTHTQRQTTRKKELVGLLHAYTIQTKRYATKYKARGQSIRQTQHNFAISYFKPCNDCHSDCDVHCLYVNGYFRENSLLERGQNAVPTNRFCSNYSSINNCTTRR